MILRPQPLTSRPTVSVVIPCYNYGRYLPDAVQSALNQAGISVDVRIVDDASTDNSAVVARALASAHRNVSVLEHGVNAGHIATYNDGLKLAEGSYVVLLSADDVLPRNALTRAVALMERHPTVGLVYGFPASFTGQPPEAPQAVRSWSIWGGRRWLRRLSRHGRNPIMSPEVIMRREAWAEIGEYDPRLPHAADMAVWLRTALAWDIGRVNGPPQALYRVHDANMHLTTYAGMATDLRERALVFDLLRSEYAPRTQDVARMHAAAMRALARHALRLAVDAGGQGRPAADELAEFAVTAYPGAGDMALWATYQNTIHSAAERPLYELGQRVVRHAAWRRWRRYGT